MSTHTCYCAVSFIRKTGTTKPLSYIRPPLKEFYLIVFINKILNKILNHNTHTYIYNLQLSTATVNDKIHQIKRMHNLRLYTTKKMIKT